MNLKKDHISDTDDKSLAVQLMYAYATIVSVIFIFGPFRLSLITDGVPFFVSSFVFIPLALMLTAIILTKKRIYKVAKYLIVLVPSYAVLFLSIFFKQYDISNNVFLYLTPRLMTILVLAAPIIFFGLRHRKHLIISSFLALIPVISFDFLHDYFNIGITSMTHDPSSYRFYVIFTSVFCALLFLTLLFFQKTGLLYKERLRQSYIVLKDEKEEVESLNEQLQFQSYLYTVLTLTSQTKSLAEILDDVLLLILGSDMLSANSKGAIYLTNENGALALIAKKNVPELEVRCNKINAGECLCGMVLKNGKNYFSPNIVNEFTPRHQYTDGLGFYIVPILDDEKKVLGTINIFVDKDKEKDSNLVVHLEAISYILAKKITDVQSKNLLKKKNLEIKLQKEKIDTTLGELNKSIDYASYLIESLIPNQNTLDAHFEDCSVLYMPRDIVSGDFYFSHKHGDYLYFGVGDCTGHGIPGAILASMSIELIKSVVAANVGEKPDVILTKLREVTGSRFDTNRQNERADSMDAAVCMYDQKEEILYYSGGFINLKIVDKDSNLTEYKATKCPIGSYILERKFELHQLKINKGDTLYITSDGYIDQFGFEYIDGVRKTKPSKYKRKRLHNLIKKHHKSTSKMQTSILKKEINNWRKELEQIDDITVMIVKH